MSEFIEVQTSVLIGPALSWAVGVAEGRELSIEPAVYGVGPRVFAAEGLTRVRYRPDTDWLQGGPLMAKYRVTFEDDLRSFCAIVVGGFGYGNDHLKSACRAIVTAKLGEVVSIPVELMT